MKTFSPIATTVGVCFSQGKGGKHGFGSVGEDYQARIEIQNIKGNESFRIVAGVAPRLPTVAPGVCESMDSWKDLTTRLEYWIMLMRKIKIYLKGERK